MLTFEFPLYEVFMADGVAVRPGSDGAGWDGAGWDGVGADPRLPGVAASLTARLSAVCRDWDAAEFRVVVDRIARTKLRWADCGYAE